MIIHFIFRCAEHKNNQTLPTRLGSLLSNQKPEGTNQEYNVLDLKGEVIQHLSEQMKWKLHKMMHLSIISKNCNVAEIAVCRRGNSYALGCILTLWGKSKPDIYTVFTAGRNGIL
nr:hypothetical protein Itr_chr12CG11150 [Ipomoea trifida]